MLHNTHTPIIAPQTLQDARRDGRLRQELSKQAKQRRSRLQELWHKYGAVGIGCYLTIYFGSTAFFYVVYDYGVMTNLPSGGTAVIEHVSFFHLDFQSRAVSRFRFDLTEVAIRVGQPAAM